MFGIAVLKFLLMIMTTGFLYVIIGIVAYRLLVSVYELLHGGVLLKELLMRMPLIVAIFLVSFIMGVLFPRDRRIVRLAAVASVLLFVGEYIGSEVYFAAHTAGVSLPYTRIGSMIGLLLLLLLVSYCLSGIVHRWASERRWRTVARGNYR